MFACIKADLVKLRSIPVQLDKSFFLLLVLLPFANIIFSGWASGLTTFLLLPCIFVFALLHEYGHCWAAQRYGFYVQGIRLWFLGGQAHICDLDRTTPKQEAFIAFAGPLTNFILAWPFAMLMLIFGNHPYLALMIGINLALGLFNLIPAYPMDGGRLLRAAIYYFSGDPFKATRIAAQIGLIVSISFMILGMMTGSIMLLLVFGWVGMVCYSILQTGDTIV